MTSRMKTHKAITAEHTGHTNWSTLDTTTTFVPCLIEHGIDKDGSTCQDPLLISRGILGEIDFECVRVGEDFNHGALWLLENYALVLLTTLISNLGLVNAERLFAAALSTRVSFSTAVDTHSTQARRWMNEV